MGGGFRRGANPPPPPGTGSGEQRSRYARGQGHARVYTEKQKHDMAARLTDVMVAFEGSEAFREVVWVLIEELHRDGWHIGGQPFFGHPTDGRLQPIKGRV